MNSTKMRGRMIFVRHASDIPQNAHWAIIEDSSVNIPGDERSRTNPGHGYPASTERIITYTAFTDEQDFKDELARVVSTNRHATSTVRGLAISHSYTVTPTVSVTIEP